MNAGVWFVCSSKKCIAGQVCFSPSFWVFIAPEQVTECPKATTVDFSSWDLKGDQRPEALCGLSSKKGTAGLRKPIMSAIQILMVEDFLPWQRYVLGLLETTPEFKVVSVASDGLEGIRKAQELQPEVILMDASLPGENGFEATRQAHRLSPRSKILFLSEHRSSDLIQGAFQAGASGYVLKSDCYPDLIRGIRAVLLGQEFVSRSLTHWREWTCGAD